MIARTWRGATLADEAQNYVEYLRRTGFREYAATAGNRGVLGLRRVRDGRAEFMLLSLWDSDGAVRRFAGQEPNRAVFYPEDETFLQERDEHVDHFEVVYADVRAPSLLTRVVRRWWNGWRRVVRDVTPDGWRLAAFR